LEEANRNVFANTLPISIYTHKKCIVYVNNIFENATVSDVF